MNARFESLWACRYNSGVDCLLGQRGVCGWNPEIEKDRRQVDRKKIEDRGAKRQYLTCADPKQKGGGACG